MKERFSALFVAGFAFVMMTVLAFGASAADTGADVERVCSACHSTKRICQSLGIKSGVVWKETVTRMARMGAQLPLNRVDEFTDHLAGQRRGRGPLCR